jgi:hypothetical protein
MHREYPGWINGTLQSLFTVGEGPKDRLSTTLWKALKDGPELLSVIRDLWGMRKM